MLCRGMQLVADEKGPRFLQQDGTPYPNDHQPNWGPTKSISCDLKTCVGYSCRSASIGSRRAARRAGIKPKTTPTMAENTNAITIISG